MLIILLKEAADEQIMQLYCYIIYSVQILINFGSKVALTVYAGI